MNKNGDNYGIKKLDIGGVILLWENVHFQNCRLIKNNVK